MTSTEVPRRSYWRGQVFGSPPIGRHWYVPEDYYWIDELDDLPASLIDRLTVHVLARWADRYAAWESPGSGFREGRLPDDAAARQKLIDDLFRQWEAARSSDLVLPIGLQKEGIDLLNQHDGEPDILTLTPDEFAQLQESWEREGLPRDLYYPSDRVRTVHEPVEVHGVMVRIPIVYSPLRWARRDPSVAARMRIPGEAERRVRFLEACNTFTAALQVRLLEVAEPAPYGDPTEVQRLQALQTELGNVQERYRRASSHVSDPLPD